MPTAAPSVPGQSAPRWRIAALVLSAAIHLAALAGLLLWHFAPAPAEREPAMTVVDLAAPPPPDQPPPPPEQPAPHPAEAARGAPAPAGPKAEAAPLAAAIPVVLPSLPAAIVPATGAAPSAGATQAGTGTGAGGAGNGTGGGGTGDGTGGGRPRGGTDPVITRGSFRQSDYPKELRETGPKGVTWADVTVGINGRVTACRITRPSGIPLFDARTCQILLQRFRYRPARDAQGKPVAASDSFSVDWDYQDLNEE